MKTLTLLFFCFIVIQLNAQSYYSPIHYHTDYVVINKHIDPYMPIILPGASFGYFMVKGKHAPKSERDALAAIGLLSGMGYAVLMETEWFTRVKKDVRYKFRAWFKK